MPRIATNPSAHNLLQHAPGPVTQGLFRVVAKDTHDFNLMKLVQGKLVEGRVYHVVAIQSFDSAPRTQIGRPFYINEGRFRYPTYVLEGVDSTPECYDFQVGFPHAFFDILPDDLGAATAYGLPLGAPV
jgi:hypothetical protein